MMSFQGWPLCYGAAAQVNFINTSRRAAQAAPAGGFSIKGGACYNGGGA